MNRIFIETEEELKKGGFALEAKDFERPWGGFFMIKEDQTGQFIHTYFPGVNADELLVNGLKVSPKILMVAPGRKLSWQYHFRRAELWRVIKGPVGIMISESDDEMPFRVYFEGDVITLKTGQRHRLIGLEDWGIIAELWLHDDPDNPSDEDDIVRVQDDFNRTTPTLKQRLKKTCQ